MKRKGDSPPWWQRAREDGFGSILGKLLFPVLLCGLPLLYALEKTEGGAEWLLARFPILGMAGEFSPVQLYIVWLVSLWIGFKIGTLAGLKKGAKRERNRLGIPY